MRQQGVFLALDEAALLALEPGVLGLADLVERLAEVAQHVELVEQDGGLRGIRVRGVAKRLPHVHDGEANAFGLLFPEKSIELVHARFAAVLAAEPDRPAPFQIADHDPVGVALADRDLIDANDLRPRGTCTPDLLAHVLHLQSLDRLPVQAQLLGDVPDRATAAAPAHVQGKALRCAARSRPGSPAARASPRHTAGNRPDAPPSRGKCGDRRRTDPAPAAAVGRTSRDAPYRSVPQIVFFPAERG